MLLLEKFSFSVINNFGTQSSELQVNFGVLQIDIVNSAFGLTCTFPDMEYNLSAKPFNA